MNDRHLVPKEQERLLEAVEAVHIAYKLLDENNDDISISFHNQAINNLPGWNIFLKNMRFEFGYQQSNVRFSILTDEETYLKFVEFLENELDMKDYEVENRWSSKYIFKVKLEEHIYEEEGIEKVVLLMNRIYELS